MRAVKIIVEPFEYISLTIVECVKALNQHGCMTITGLIRHDHEQEYMALAARETWVCVKAVSESGEEQVFFHGILTGMQMKKEAQASMMTIEARTGSFLLDIEKHTRSFQDAGFSYESVVASCVTPAGGYSIMLEKEDVPTGCFLMQYNETDWAFIRRIASYVGVVLCPEYATGGKKARSMRQAEKRFIWATAEGVSPEIWNRTVIRWYRILGQMRRQMHLAEKDLPARRHILCRQGRFMTLGIPLLFRAESLWQAGLKAVLRDRSFAIHIILFRRGMACCLPCTTACCMAWR